MSLQQHRHVQLGEASHPGMLGDVSADRAKHKAEGEFEQWRARTALEPSAVERHFNEAISGAKKIETGKKLHAKKPAAKGKT